MELRSLTTTGGHQVWPAARVLLPHILSRTLSRASLDDGERHHLLELGSGTGWLSLNVVAQSPEWVHVTATEQRRSDAQSLLRHNFSLNPSLAHRCRVAVLDLLDDDAGAKVEPDVAIVFGSDLIYNDELAMALPRVVARLLGRPDNVAAVLYAHTFRRYDHLDTLFLRELTAQGLVAWELGGNGVRRPVVALSESEFDLFPEQEVRVLEIERA